MIESIPKELLSYIIISFLDYEETIKLNSINKYFQNIFEENGFSFWKQLLLKYYPNLNPTGVNILIDNIF